MVKFSPLALLVRSLLIGGKAKVRLFPSPFFVFGFFASLRLMRLLRRWACEESRERRRKKKCDFREGKNPVGEKKREKSLDVQML